jgi:hypothetical protein
MEWAINGQSSERCRAIRDELSVPLVADPEMWIRQQRAKLSRRNDFEGNDYMLKRWSAFIAANCRLSPR